MSLGKKIEMLRNNKGLTQRKLAYELEVSNTAIAKLEKDENLPNSKLLIKICKLFNVSSDWLLGLKEERN